MTRTSRRTFLGAAGGAALAGLAGCSGGSAGDGGAEATTTRPGDGGDGDAPLKLGVLLPFTGEYDWVGGNVFPVAEMLVTRLNEAGGIDGREVRLVKGDTEATVDASVTAARKLVNVDSVSAILGPTSLTFTGVVDLVRENEVPVVSPTAGTTELDDVGGTYIFRTVPSDTLGGRAVAKAARDEAYNGVASYDRMGLMVGQAPALQSFKEPIRSSFEAFGGTVVRTLDFATGKSAYQSEVSKMLETDPELVTLVGSPEDSAKILRAAFQAGYDGNWFFTQDQTNRDFLELVDPRITDGVLGLVEADNPDAVESGRVEAFAADVEAATGSQPGVFAKNTYDAVNIVTLAMAAAATGGEVTRQSVAERVPAVANPGGTTVLSYEDGVSALADGAVDYDGLVGPCDFDANGDITSPFAIMRADGREWKQVATLPADEL
jgi:neutral amino acid transport system substrate-binding protein